MILRSSPTVWSSYRDTNDPVLVLQCMSKVLGLQKIIVRQVISTSYPSNVEFQARQDSYGELGGWRDQLELIKSQVNWQVESQLLWKWTWSSQLNEKPRWLKMKKKKKEKNSGLSRNWTLAVTLYPVSYSSLLETRPLWVHNSGNDICIEMWN